MADDTTAADVAAAPEPVGEGRVESTGATGVPVQPVERKSAPAGPSSLRIQQGAAFSYAVPERWRVVEEGQFAVVLAAPDDRALTILVGNSGLPPRYPPAQFVYEKLSAMRVENLRLGQPRAAQPIAGFAQAVEYDVTFARNGVPQRGVAKCHVLVAYDSAVMAMTSAVSDDEQWEAYARWLPQVADQAAALNGAAFGQRGIMAQNLRNSTAFAAAARNYREWSQQNWQATVDQRNESADRRHSDFRETLGGVESYASPFEPGRTVELPLSHKYFWMDPQGKVMGSDDPTYNPNEGSTLEWRRMQRPPR